jgi:hypothetical protein
MRTGVRAATAASSPSRPPFGVCAWTIAGRCRRNSRCIVATARRSAPGVIRRAMATASTSMSSSVANCCSSGPGEVIARTVKPRACM